MSNNQQLTFFTISSNADVGQVLASSSVVASTTLNKGVYKIAAMHSGLLWKLGSTDVNNTTGSFLAAGDQEVIMIEANSTKLSWVIDSFSTDPGSINIVPVTLYDLPQGDFRAYA